MCSGPDPEPRVAGLRSFKVRAETQSPAKMVGDLAHAETPSREGAEETRRPGEGRGRCESPHHHPYIVILNSFVLCTPSAPGSMP